MDTLTIQLKNNKAYKLLRDMEELGLIKVVEKTSSQKLSRLRGKVHSRMDNDQIDNQIKAIRQEWQRDI